MPPVRRWLRRYGEHFKADEGDIGDEEDARLLEPVTERIIGCAFRVANTLGHGFVEKFYESALAQAIRNAGSVLSSSAASSWLFV